MAWAKHGSAWVKIGFMNDEVSAADLKVMAGQHLDSMSKFTGSQEFIQNGCKGKVACIWSGRGEEGIRWMKKGGQLYSNSEIKKVILAAAAFWMDLWQARCFCQGQKVEARQSKPRWVFQLFKLRRMARFIQLSYTDANNVSRIRIWYWILFW